MTGKQKSRRDMTEEERAEAQRHARHSAYRREVLGLPDRVTPEETARAIAKVRKMAYVHGMSTAQICEQTGLSKSTIKDTVNGVRGGPGHAIRDFYRPTYNAIMAAGIVPSDGRQRVPIGPTRRRVQALSHHGYDLRAIAEFLGFVNYQRVWQLQHRSSFVYYSTAVRVAEVYDKHIGEDPADYGVSEHARERSRMAAEKSLWAPSWCWDSDTIDDLSAEPEWTGVCGTAEGYRVHVREGVVGRRYMPLCLACRTAVETRQIESDRFTFRADRFGEILERGGVSIRGLAKRMGMPGDGGLHKWRSGAYGPQHRGTVEKLAGILGCDVDDLIIEPVSLLKPSKSIVQPGQFNPYVARIVIDYAQMSQAEAARVSGAAEKSLNSWLLGRARPSDRSKAKALAEALGVDVEDFYA